MQQPAQHVMLAIMSLPSQHSFPPRSQIKINIGHRPQVRNGNNVRRRAQLLTCAVASISSNLRRSVVLSCSTLAPCVSSWPRVVAGSTAFAGPLRASCRTTTARSERCRDSSTWAILQQQCRHTCFSDAFMASAAKVHTPGVWQEIGPGICAACHLHKCDQHGEGVTPMLACWSVNIHETFHPVRADQQAVFKWHPPKRQHGSLAPPRPSNRQLVHGNKMQTSPLSAPKYRPSLPFSAAQLNNTMCTAAAVSPVPLCASPDPIASPPPTPAPHLTPEVCSCILGVPRSPPAADRKCLHQHLLLNQTSAQQLCPALL